MHVHVYNLLDLVHLGSVYMHELYDLFDPVVVQILQHLLLGWQS